MIYFLYSDNGLFVGVFGIVGSLACDGVFEYLFAVYFFFYSFISDEAIDDNIFILFDFEYSVYSLSIGGRILVGVI